MTAIRQPVAFGRMVKMSSNGQLNLCETYIRHVIQRSEDDNKFAMYVPKDFNFKLLDGCAFLHNLSAKDDNKITKTTYKKLHSINDVFPWQNRLLLKEQDGTDKTIVQVTFKN
ncbi:Hypothetical protein ORPV_288 [Orpheovirus IHUMI-LCC2]|uniref:Uncharacterized protein n=1 Tax=Orpheovirus IHUMI-LCC2 TaxID=2023057 RepID=A0A2I2L3S2_9VIRU|nr:Hypothetical protein ORPV_288 [Orpheovirus IHUMI-LCC2]SNW62192.1 Hypothetical protein ORPV_288 [Orpheovirus IHUMI-LCC2]